MKKLSDFVIENYFEDYFLEAQESLETKSS